MNSIQRIARNALFLYGSRVVITVTKFVLFVSIARMLGDVELGKFSFAIAFTAFFSILISLGMDDLFVREVARDRTASAKYIGNMTIMRAILSVTVFALMVVAINFMGYSGDARLVVYIFGGYVVITGLSHVFVNSFIAFERMGWAALLEVLEGVTTVSLTVYLLSRGAGIVEVSLVFVLAAVINLVISIWVCTKKFTRPRFEFDLGFWKTTVVNAAPFAVATLFVLHTRVDTIILSALKGDAVVGEYSAAYQVVLAFDPFVITLMSVVFPALSRLFVSSREMMQLAYEKSIKYLVMVGLPLSIGGAVLAEPLISVIYGPEFTGSVAALQVLAWNCVLLSANRPMLFALGAMNRQRTSALITIGALVFSALLNLALVPLWSYVGSGVASLATGFGMTVAGWYAISRLGYSLSPLRTILKPLVAGLVMGAVVYVGSTLTTASLPLLVLIGAATYTAVIYLIRGLSKDDYELVREAIRIRKPQA